jgi:lipopolysaccharide transport system ATP-binding protein
MADLVSIGCYGVSKRFDLVDAGSAWRVVFRPSRPVLSFEALKDITLEVAKGEFVGVLGRNGAGKSTLLRTIGGVYQPSAGRVEVNGDLSAIYELGVAGSGEMTGRDYARRMLMLSGASGARLERLLEETREFSELDDRFDDYILTYSTGMVARLYFAVATAETHDVYLIDEILVVGDQHFQAKCWARVRERFAQGASGILVTHDWSAVIKLCRTAHIMEGGRIVFSGRADQVVREYLQASVDSEEGIARFAPTLPERFSWESGRDCRFRIPVEILRPEPVAFRLSIEQLRLGVGWEIAILSRQGQPVASVSGRYDVEVVIPSLPLTPGRYVLNLFLTIEPRGGEPRRVLDVRGWLNSKSLEVEVTGEASGGLLRLPVGWEFSAA